MEEPPKQRNREKRNLAESLQDTQTAQEAGWPKETAAGTSLASQALFMHE